MPSFGRPQGRSSGSASGMPPKFPPQDVFYFNPIEQRNSAIVTDLAERFFGRNQTEAEDSATETLPPQISSNSLPAIPGLEASPMESNAGELDESLESPANLSEVENEYNKGQLIDRYI